MTFHAREIQSYKELPQLWYHFTIKDRDEPRPRGGLLRVREFIMKDSYSFDRDEAGLEVSFQRHAEAYARIFERCGLETFQVEAESGIMGGKDSSGFLAPTGSGENELMRCENGDYFADIEAARGAPRAPDFPERLDAPEEIETPGVATIDGARGAPRHRPCGDLEGDAGRRRRPCRPRARARRRSPERGEADHACSRRPSGRRPRSEIRETFGAGGGSIGPIGARSR